MTLFYAWYSIKLTLFNSFITDINHDYSESDNSASDMSISTERSVSPPSSNSPPPASEDVTSLSRTPPNVLPPIRTPSSGDPSSTTKSRETESSDSSRVSCPDDDCDNTKKLSKKSSRTNFTKEQVQALLKIFHETPYPDSEMMESIGKDLNIKEKQVKVREIYLKWYKAQFSLQNILTATCT